MNLNQFKNLSRIKDLPTHEQNRQWFIYQSNLIYEQSFSNRTSAVSTPSAGGTSRPPLPVIYAFNLSYQFLGIQFTQTLGVESNQIPTDMTFPGSTVFEKNTDDGLQYFISYDDSLLTTYFCKFNEPKNDSVTVIDEINITSLNTTYPSSLYYEGDGNFIYLSGSYIGGGGETFSNVVRVNVDGSCELVCTVDNSTYYPQVLFPYNNEVWGAYGYGGFLNGVGKFDFMTAEFTTFDDIILTGVPNLMSWKIIFVLGTTTYNQDIYFNLFVLDKEISQPFQIITTFNPDTLEAKFVSFVNISDNPPILDITTL